MLASTKPFTVCIVYKQTDLPNLKNGASQADVYSLESLDPTDSEHRSKHIDTSVEIFHFCLEGYFILLSTHFNSEL